MLDKQILAILFWLGCCFPGFAQQTIIQTAEGVFTTRLEASRLPLPESDDAFQFVVFGDRTGGDRSGLKVLRQAVQDTNLLDPDFVLTVGDLIQGYNRPSVNTLSTSNRTNLVGEATGLGIFAAFLLPNRGSKRTDLIVSGGFI